MYSQELKDIRGKKYTLWNIVLEQGSKLSFCTNTEHEDDYGYVLFELKMQGEPSNVQTYFGLKREEVREFANKLLDITAG